MPRFLLTFQYDGTDFSGWQRQSDEHRTVQQVVETAIADLAGFPINVHGASRTDTGVHARAMPAHIDLTTRLRGEELRRAIEVRLPFDVALLAVREVADDFHCRHHALGKCYAYRIHNARRRSPLMSRYAHFLAPELNLAAMREAAQTLIGKHDFSAFATLLSEYPNRLTTQPDPTKPDKPVGNIRELFAIEILKRGHLLTFLVFGDGFLRGMVRGLVGTLVETGLDKLTAADVKNILASKDRREAGANLPGSGLTLEAVFYETSELERWTAAARHASAGEPSELADALSVPMELL